MKNKVILLHICCAVDLVYTVEILKKEYKDVVLYFYDPNIHPYSEYLIRLYDVQRIAKKHKLSLIVGEYNVSDWLKKSFGLQSELEGGARCIFCHGNILNSTFKLAKENSYDIVTTTLYMSPLKDFKKLDSIGEKLAKKYGVDFLKGNFRKNNGINITQKLVKENYIYRQSYCGCIYALFNMDSVEKYNFFCYIKKGLYPFSKESFQEILSLRNIFEDYGLKCRLKNYSTIAFFVKRAFLSFNGKVISNFFVAPYSISIKRRTKLKVIDVIHKQKYSEVILNRSNIRLVVAKEYVKIKDDYDTTPMFYIDFVPEIGDRFEVFLETDFVYNYKLYYLEIGNSVNCIHEQNVIDVPFFRLYNREKTIKYVLKNVENKKIKILSRW